MKLVIPSSRPIAQVASEIGVVEGILGDWVRVWKEEHPDAGAKDPGPVEWAKFKALQAENAELKREIEFLGKVSDYAGDRCQVPLMSSRSMSLLKTFFRPI